MGIFDYKLWKRSQAQTPFVITPYSRESVGLELAAQAAAAPASLAWPAANRAYLIPFRLNVDATLKQILFANGTVVSGNIDVGVYKSDLTRVVSMGSTAQSGVDSTQVLNVTDTFLPAGAYYMAAVLDNTSGRGYWSGGAAGGGTSSAILGILQADSSFPLPSTITPTARTGVVWAMCLDFRAAV